MSERLRQNLSALAGLVLFVAALEVLRVELRTVTWHELMADVFNTPLAQTIVAVFLTSCSYAGLTGYDFLAFASIGKSLPARRIATVSFLAYAISNTVSFGMLSGAFVRHRFYARWGTTSAELSRIVFFYSVTFWLGLLALGGLSLVAAPLPDTFGLLSSRAAAMVGGFLVLAPALYLLATLVRREPLRVGHWAFPLPTLRIGVAQLIVSAADWALAGAVLYTLLPPGDLGFLPFLGSFLAATLVGAVSHVPGGMGVFEGLTVLLLKPYYTAGQLVPALVMYRAVYYLLPFVVALAGLVVDEMRQRRALVRRAGEVLGQLTEQLLPRVLAVATFLAGLVLLLSGATPAATGRLALVARVLPLGVVEVSHFLGSIAGAILLLLSQGLARRLDAAYYLAAAAMVVGMITSLLKGFDYEEVAVLGVVLAMLWRAGPAFDRRAAFFETRFSMEWIAALAGAMAASVWLGLFAFQHVDYSRDLWWQFELQGEVSRFLRASVGVAVIVLLFAFRKMIGQTPHDVDPPSDADLEAAARAIATQTSTMPNLVYLRDKALIFTDDGAGFVMYGVQGRTWVALGDPVGPEDRLNDLLRRFLERCDDLGGDPVFYEIGTTHLHRYVDCGLTFVKLGEEARVDLSTFTLEGSKASKYRQAIRRLEKDGVTFRIVDAVDVPAIMDRLRTVSDQWLRAKAGAEKGFSLGFFDEAYVARFPVAVVERDGRVEAFANLWPGPQRIELSIDLMRYGHDAPKGVMETMLVCLLKWGKAQGYRWFALGMAPLSGFERSPVASLWNRTGAFLYEHGDAVYNFQGLRAFKEKFDPVWEPRYLAYPGGLGLPRVLANVSALVAGGYRRIFLR